MKKFQGSTNNEESKKILFREIEMVIKPEVSKLSNIKIENCFIMVANNKVYYLVAKTEDD